MNMKLQAILERIGFDGKASAIYLALLTQGPASVSDIARRTGIHRPAIYRALADMQGRGLIVRVVRGKRHRYAAASPKRIHELLAEAQGAFAQELPALLQ